MYQFLSFGASERSDNDKFMRPQKINKALGRGEKKQRTWEKEMQHPNELMYDRTGRLESFFDT